MVKKKACKKCKLFVEGNQCPNCKSEAFATVWQGRINILDSKKSMVTEKMGITQKGEYAIKVR